MLSPISSLPAVLAMYHPPFLDHLNPGDAIGMLALLGGILVAIIVPSVALYFYNRRQQMWHETARLALEKGQPVPTAPGQAPLNPEIDPAVAGLHTADATARVAVLDQIRSQRIRGYLLGGMINLAVGAGLFLAMQQLSRQTAYFAAIPAFVGVALILAAWFESLAGSKPRT